MHIPSKKTLLMPKQFCPYQMMQLPSPHLCIHQSLSLKVTSNIAYQTTKHDRKHVIAFARNRTPEKFTAWPTGRQYDIHNLYCSECSSLHKNFSNLFLLIETSFYWAGDYFYWLKLIFPKFILFFIILSTDHNLFLLN